MRIAFPSAPAQGGVRLGWRVNEDATVVVLLNRTVVNHGWIIPQRDALHNAGFETQPAFVPETDGLRDQWIRY